MCVVSVHCAEVMGGGQVMCVDVLLVRVLRMNVNLVRG